jgi:hypothetical protein
MEKLYPLRIEPILKERIRGGHKLITHLNKELANSDKIGKSWVISALEKVPILSMGLGKILKSNYLEKLLTFKIWFYCNISGKII